MQRFASKQAQFCITLSWQCPFTVTTSTGTASGDSNPPHAHTAHRRVFHPQLKFARALSSHRPLPQLCLSPLAGLNPHRRAQNLLRHPFKAPTAGDALTAPSKHPNKLHHPCRFSPQAADALTRSQRCLASLSALLLDSPRCKHTAARLQRCRRCHDSDGAVPGLPTDCP
jgi:hypothetical protein